MELKKEVFINSLFGSITIIIGVMLAEHAHEMYLPIFAPLTMIGMMTFMLGWYLFTKKSEAKNHNMVQLSAVMVIVFAMVSNLMMMMGKSSAIFGVLFALSWLMLGYYVGERKSGDKDMCRQYFAYMGSLMIVISMAILNNWQRSNLNGNVGKGYVYGPGVPMFVLGWMFITLANSMK